MNVVNGILEQLKRSGKVSVPEFGIFSTENSTAIFDSETKTILPPAKQILFDAGYDIQNDAFLQFLAKENNASLEQAKSELKIQTDYWKNKLKSYDAFSIEGLGNFHISENQISFKGERIQTGSSDFFGLEEINIHEIKKSKKEAIASQEKSADYRFNNSILWVFLLLLPLSGLIYLGITQQERVFGKKSFDDYTVKNSTHRIDEGNSKVNIDQQNFIADSLKLADSLKNDSLKKAAIVPVKKSVQSWKPKNKYIKTNKKWKPKKQRNH